MIMGIIGTLLAFICFVSAKSNIGKAFYIPLMLIGIFTIILEMCEQ